MGKYTIEVDTQRDLEEFTDAIENSNLRKANYNLQELAFALGAGAPSPKLEDRQLLTLMEAARDYIKVTTEGL